MVINITDDGTKQPAPSSSPLARRDAAEDLGVKSGNTC